MEPNYDTDYSEIRKMDRKIFATITLLVIIASLVAHVSGNTTLAKLILLILGSFIIALIALVEFARTL